MATYTLAEKLNLDNALQIQEDLIAIIDNDQKDNQLTLDAASTVEIDIVGIQLLLAVQIAATRKELEFKIVKLNKELKYWLNLSGVAELIME